MRREKITFLKWEKWNRRQKGVGRTYWFSFDNHPYQDPIWDELTGEEYKCFVALLSFASQNNENGAFYLWRQMFLKLTGLRVKELESTLIKLQAHDIIKVTRAPGRASPEPLQDKTIQDKTVHNNAHSDEMRKCVLNSYNHYPRKLGKRAGVEWAVKNIPPERAGEFDRAVHNYATYCRTHKTEPRFIKHFSTWVKDWEEWLEPPTAPKSGVAEAWAILCEDD